MRYLRGQFLRACRLWLQTVPLPASGQKIFEYLHDSRQHGADLRLQTWFVISYHPPTMGNLSFRWIFSCALLSASAQGYTGRKCERCSPGYYGFPHLPAGKCTPCECNPAGSLNDECDTETGQCRCRAGSTGRDCSECTAYRHVFINNVCTCKEILLSLNLFRSFSSSLTDLIIFFPFLSLRFLQRATITALVYCSTIWLRLHKN